MKLNLKVVWIENGASHSILCGSWQEVAMFGQDVQVWAYRTAIDGYTQRWVRAR